MVLGAESIKPCRLIEARGDVCVFDLKANADALLQVDTKAIRTGQRWRVTIVEVGQTEQPPSNLGTGSTAGFTGLVER